MQPISENTVLLEIKLAPVLSTVPPGKSFIETIARPILPLKKIVCVLQKTQRRVHFNPEQYIPFVTPLRFNIK
jgi:hypothetical protein